MSAGTDTPSSLSMLDGSYRKNVTVTRDEKSNTFENMKQPNIGKPPRHLSAIRYCVSSAQLSPATEVVRFPILRMYHRTKYFLFVNCLY